MVKSRSLLCLGVACLELHAVEFFSGGPIGHFLERPQGQKSWCWLCVGTIQKVT